MTEEKKYTAQEWHTKSAIDLFNWVWSLLDKEDRIQQEDDQMVHAAHASRHHWGELGTPREVERGEWQISGLSGVCQQVVGTYEVLVGSSRYPEIFEGPACRCGGKGEGNLRQAPIPPSKGRHSGAPWPCY